VAFVNCQIFGNVGDGANVYIHGEQETICTFATVLSGVHGSVSAACPAPPPSAPPLPPLPPVPPRPPPSRPPLPLPPLPLPRPPPTTEHATSRRHGTDLGNARPHTVLLSTTECIGRLARMRLSPQSCRAVPA
jgi:hypothetical protein